MKHRGCGVGDADVVYVCENCEKQTSEPKDWVQIRKGGTLSNLWLCDPCMTRACELLYAETDKRILFNPSVCMWCGQGVLVERGSERKVDNSGNPHSCEWERKKKQSCHYPKGTRP